MNQRRTKDCATEASRVSTPSILTEQLSLRKLPFVFMIPTAFRSISPNRSSPVCRYRPPRGHSEASHGHAFTSLGAARSGEQRSDAERFLRRAGEADLRLQRRAADAGAVQRCREAGQPAHFGKCPSHLDRGSISKCEESQRYNAVFR